MALTSEGDQTETEQLYRVLHFEMTPGPEQTTLSTKNIQRHIPEEGALLSRST